MNTYEKETGSGFLVETNEGEWAGWNHWMPGDPFEDYVGPFYTKRDAQGVVCGFLPSAKNCNAYANIHGGALMTFADFALFMIPGEGGAMVHGVTVTMNCEFISGARPGIPLYARGETVKAGRSLLFVRGTIVSEDKAVLIFSGTIKRILT
jgi:uncharacterized protein (TIGR00369 family)